MTEQTERRSLVSRVRAPNEAKVSHAFAGDVHGYCAYLNSIRTRDHVEWFVTGAKDFEQVRIRYNAVAREYDYREQIRRDEEVARYNRELLRTGKIDAIPSRKRITP